MQVGIEALIASTGSLQSLPQLASQVETTIQDLLRLPKVLLLVRNVEGNFTSSSTVISEQDPFLRWLISRIRANQTQSYFVRVGNLITS